MEINEAREILQEDFINLSDSQILALIDLVDAISRYVVISEFGEEISILKLKK